MRVKPTRPASVRNSGDCFGQIVLSSHALAKEEPVCPLGNDHEPGRLPITSACTILTNGRRRRKYALIGYSISHVAMTTLGSRRLTARHDAGTRTRYASSVPITQIQPPVVMIATAQARLSR